MTLNPSSWPKILYEGGPEVKIRLTEKDPEVMISTEDAVRTGIISTKALRRRFGMKEQASTARDILPLLNLASEFTCELSPAEEIALLLGRMDIALRSSRASVSCETITDVDWSAFFFNR